MVIGRGGGGGGGRVPVAPVSMGAFVQQRESTRHPQLETCFFRENVKTVRARTVLKYPKPVIRLIRLTFGASLTMNTLGAQKGQPINVIYKNVSTYKS